MLQNINKISQLHQNTNKAVCNTNKQLWLS